MKMIFKIKVLKPNIFCQILSVCYAKVLLLYPSNVRNVSKFTALSVCIPKSKHMCKYINVLKIADQII